MKIFASDFHIQPFKSSKFKTQKKSFGESIIQWFADRLKRKAKRLIHQMAEHAKGEPNSLVVINGDLMEAKCTEQGWRTNEDLKAARIIKWTLCNIFSEAKILFNAGNHETGYSKEALPLVTDPMAGVYKQSIENYLKFSDRKELYHAEESDGFLVILVPYLFTEPSARDFNIHTVKRKFLQKMKKDLLKYDRIILFIHDPDSLMNPDLLKLIQQFRSKICQIFFGHYHSEINLMFTKVLIKIFTANWMFLIRPILRCILWIIFGRNTDLVCRVEDYFIKRTEIPKLIKSLEATLIPAPTGMFGIGGGYLVMEIENGKSIIKKYSS